VVPGIAATLRGHFPTSLVLYHRDTFCNRMRHPPDPCWMRRVGDAMRLQFTAKLENRPEAFAELLQTLAARGVDLRSIGLTSIECQSAAVFTTNNDSLTHKVLAGGGWTFFEGES
jgi:hypothetical protein